MKIEDLALRQNTDGSFGKFHSMSIDNSITTEKALRRFLFLNLDNDYPVVKKCIDYVKQCLYKNIVIPDRREKVINWDVFEELMFSAWLNNFHVDDEKVSSIQLVWKSVIENSIIDNKFSFEEYKKQYRLTFGAKGLKVISPSSFYMVCLLAKKLTLSAKQAYFQYVMEQGIYYIYNKNLFEVPTLFDSKNTIYYLIAIKLISPYASENELNFVKTWIYKHRSLEGYWDMPNLKPDGTVFPRINNWRKNENKLADISQFINDVLSVL